MKYLTSLFNYVGNQSKYTVIVFNLFQIKIFQQVSYLKYQSKNLDYYYGVQIFFFTFNYNVLKSEINNNIISMELNKEIINK